MILEEMLAELAQARKEVLPSKYWQELNKKNLGQLKEVGLNNFKQTLALNYFTFLVNHKDKQFGYLCSHLNKLTFIKIVIKSIFSKKHSFFDRRQSLKYNLLTHMLWEFVKKHDDKNYLKSVEEPLFGNPPAVYSQGKLISQDLANSILEFYSIMDSHVDPSTIHSIMELGAGYGRTSYVFLKILKNIRFFVVDIPPALYVAQEYLSSVFTEKKIFTFRPFTDFAQIEDELVNSDIIFLMPNQLELLPDGYVDLSYNISSLHEMRLDQIDYYFQQFNRLTKQYFYTKQMKVSRIPYDNITIKDNEYPVPKKWSLIFHRECKVQSYFFEALYQTNGH